MLIAVPVLVLLALSLLIPNVLAIRLAIGPSGSTAAADSKAGSETGSETGSKAAVSVIKRLRRLVTGRFFRGGYLWKALSPLVFAMAVILGLGLKGPVGLAVVGVAFLNLLWGLLGWNGLWQPGRGARQPDLNG